MIPEYSDADFQLGMQRLMPTGAIWPRDPDAKQAQVIGALTKVYTRNSDRAQALLVDAFPVAPVELLPEWEETLGLPDPCAGPSPTIQQRQEQVAARFIAGGGQSIGFFISYAAALGYPITVTQFVPFRAGHGHAGDPIYGSDWAHAWQVNAPTFNVEYFRAGRDAAGEPLATWGTAVLQCELQRLAPAQTKVLFRYS